MYKKGVTLLTVAIAIIILAIIAGTVIVSSVGIVEKAETVKFAEEVELLEDKIEEYYVATGDYPVLSETYYTSGQLTSLNDTINNLQLAREIEDNGDLDSTFYLIDYDKIKVKLLVRGLESEPADIYVVAKETNTVYYVKGVEFDGKMYFSLVNISNIIKLK